MYIKFQFRYSVASMLMLVTVLCGLLAWIAHQRHSFSREKLAAEQLRTKYGASVYIDSVYVDGNSIDGNKPDDPVWRLRKIGSGRLYVSFSSIFIHDAVLDDNAAALLQNLAYLDRVHIQDSELKCETIFSSPSFDYLTSLDIYDTPVSVAQLAAISALPSLRVLALGNSGVSDEGLRCIGRMRSLETLAVCDARLTEDFLSHLSAMKNLRELILDSVEFPPSGLRYVGERPCKKSCVS